MVDRFGQTRVLPGALLAHTAAVASLLALTSTREHGAAGAAAPLYAVPPVLVLSSVLTTASVPPAALTRAFTWLNSASAAGSAGAAAPAGSSVDAHGAHGGFAVAAAATSAMAVLASGRLYGARRHT